MKFSVLMSLYYKEKPEYLYECLASLIEQTLAPDEIVIVFDGDLPEKLKVVVDDFLSLKLPIKIVPLDVNVGLGKALNAGLEACVNEWVFRMDTDDICVPERFEKQIEFIKKNPDIVLLGSNIEEFDEAMSLSLGVRKVPLLLNDIKKYALMRSPFNHMTVAYKKSIIQKVGGYKHHLFMEDYNLWLRLLSVGYSMANLPLNLVKARTGNSMYERRRGIAYIKSEYKLMNLKIDLQLQNFISAYFYFILRTVPRFLPSKYLGKLYKFILRN